MDKPKQLEEEISITESIKIENRTHFSLTHIRSAINTTNLCTQLENQYKDPKEFPNEQIIDYQGFAAISVMSSVAFLEALINEFYRDVNDDFKNANKLEKETKEIIKFYWNLEKPSIERDFRILDKYNFALQLANKIPYDKNITPYRDVRFLIDLRNSLTHYKLFPHISDDEVIPTPSKLESSLKGKFELSPYQTGKANAFFPDKCLSRGCAIWAIESSLQFTEQFFSKLGMPIPYEYAELRYRFNRDE